MPFDINKELQSLEADKQPRTPLEVIKQRFDDKYNPKPLGLDGGDTGNLYQGDTVQAAVDLDSQQRGFGNRDSLYGQNYDQNGNPYHYNKEKGNINLEIIIPLIIIALGIFYFFRLLLKK